MIDDCKVIYLDDGRYVAYLYRGDELTADETVADFLVADPDAHGDAVTQDGFWRIVPSAGLVRSKQGPGAFYGVLVGRAEAMRWVP